MRRKGSRPGRSDGGRPAVPAGDARALRSVVAALRGADSAEAVISVALDTIRSEFGWEYASFWREDPQARVLRFAQESGSVSDDFRQVTASATFAPGVGLAGRTWQSRRLIHVPDLGEVDDCVRAPVARRAGVRAGVCLPLVVGDRVIGTMDFLAVEQLDLTEDRRLTLEAVADLVGQSLTRLQDLRAAAEIAEDSEAVTASVSALNQADDEASALRLALDQVRSSFGWAYGSVWTVGDDELLRFAVESGTVNPEFREITLTSTFARGVGLSGRAWQQRRLIFVEDLAEVTDCVRAPAARRAGVQSGVCLPIVVDDQVVATMDFFATHRLEPGRHRLDALASVGTLVGQALQRLRRIREVSQVAAELAESVAHVAEGSGRATVAANTAVEAAQHALTAVTALEASSKDIGNIARVISGIAEQTNLLALNATIEAARAGEAGKGFAVVAQEVKELARETAQATDDVASRIASIQADTVAATASIDSIGATIAQIHEIQNDLSAVLQQQSSIASAFVGQPGRN